MQTLDAPQPVGRLRPRRRADLPPAAWLSRATVIDVAHALTEAEAADWLSSAGEDFLAAGVIALNRALAAYRIAAADYELNALDRRQAVAARVGVGAGEEVASGRYTEVRELAWHPLRRSRRRLLAPESRLAAILTGRDRPLVAEELALRARADLEAGRLRHGALQVLIALDAAIAELSGTPTPGLAERVAELDSLREPVAQAAQAALGTEPTARQATDAEDALTRVEAALRAHAASVG